MVEGHVARCAVGGDAPGSAARTLERGLGLSCSRGYCSYALPRRRGASRGRPRQGTRTDLGGRLQAHPSLVLDLLLLLDFSASCAVNVVLLLLLDNVVCTKSRV